MNREVLVAFSGPLPVFPLSLGHQSHGTTAGRPQAPNTEAVAGLLPRREGPLARCFGVRDDKNARC